ncbi:hypothetical protein TSAR_015583 [Trichomalopsis sarcophagae]|uniref:Uncharacterized protein n=1 Tax=Trichomalopsis sarcophagae TaxID=543379 RepID=A0A232EW05_9HYME|nr:hypothetical protein TSAR_015583 [Trichomalopsis sarcophagae]
MQLQSVTSSQDILRPADETLNHYSKEERRRTGRYVAGGAALAIILIAVYHVFARGASTMAGICIPAIIMVTYILWVLYAARRDRIRTLRLASAMNLPNISDNSNICDMTRRNITNPQKSTIDV